MLTIVVLVGIFASEVLSNLALVVIFIPVVAAFAKESGFSVIQLSIALTFGASCAFMMPVGTPPNAIAYSSGYIKIHQMIKYGFVMNLISAIVIIFFSFMFL
jgi:sodium-dependent dicarboxylate transporter 2/3/5